MRFPWLKQFVATAVLSCGMVAYGQQVEDFDFVVRQIETNYAGFPTLADTAGYRTLKERLRNQVVENQRKGYMAAAELVGWFGDTHLRLGNYSQTYSSHRQPTVKGNGYNPDFVATKVNDQTFLIRVPSFDDTKEEIDQAVADYRASGCPYLVVDLRGNGGGLDNNYLSLRALLYDHPGQVDGVEFRNTPDHRATVRALDQPWAIELADAMEQQSDSAFYPVTPRQWELKYDSIERFPLKAALIINDEVASAGEQFVLDVRATSDRTTIYGRENTLGVLDYSNAAGVNLPHSGLTLYVPISRSCRLPDRGIDRTGIAPDVRITLPNPKKLDDNIDSWVKWVATKLNKK